MTYDIIIVGAGPSGLTAAMTAAADGLSVLLLDTKEHITRQTRPCCAMWILEPGFHNEAWTFKDGKIYFHRNDFCIPYRGETVALHRSVRIAASGNSLVMGKKLTPIARVIDKQILLQGLLDRAIAAGVEVRPRTTCTGIEEGSAAVRVKLRHAENEEWVSGRYLLAADGVDSVVAEALGLNKTRKIIIRTSIIHYYYADVKTDLQDAWVQFIGDGFNGVSGTLLHKPDRDGDRDIYEVGVLPPHGSGMGLKEAMERLTSHPMLKKWLAGARLIKKAGCRWTCWTPISAPARGRVILVGDAASFQEVENQGAIMCGFRAAKAVCMQENGAGGFGAYNHFWQQSFEFNDPEILSHTWRGFILQQLGKEHIDYILGLARGLLLDGYINHFKCGDVILSFIISRLPQIERERPALADKIKQLQHFRLDENLLGDDRR